MDPARNATGRHLRMLLILIGVIYLWLCTDRAGDLYDRQQFGDIYDHLALVLLQGRFDLPKDVIGPEAFVIDGKYYGYWAPFPALLRIPFVLMPEELWVGHTARLMCWLAGMLTVWAAWAILTDMRAVLGVNRAVSSLLLCYLVALALGSHIPYLLAAPTIYHEAVLWGTALALISLRMGLLYLRSGRYSWLFCAILLAGAAALTRATTGYGALAGCITLGAGRFFAAHWRHRVQGRPRDIWFHVAGLALIAVLSFLPLLYNYVRFGTFVRLPYDKHPAVAAWRLEITKHGNFQPANIIPNITSYFDPTQIGIRSGFPHFHLAAYRQPAGARIEHAEAYASLAASMTGLCSLAVAGALLACRDRRLLWIAAGGMLTFFALMSFTAVAHRYGHDLFPLLVSLSASALLWLDGRSTSWWAVPKVVLVLLLALGVWQSMSFAYYEQEWTRRWYAGR